jgi:hypothetical protein
VRTDQVPPPNRRSSAVRVHQSNHFRVR